jgi:hypothetical protein
MKTYTLTACLVFAIVFFSTCSKKDAATGGGSSKTFSCTSIAPTFTGDVQPILTTVCSINSNCHAGGTTNSGGPFTNYTEVNARKADIRAAILSGTMPQSGSISQAQVNAFICWIDSGAPNN